MSGAEPKVDEDLPVPIGSVLADKYRIERMIGSGGMGVVALARHLKLGQKVAIKMLRASAAQNRELLERFSREARALSRISSEHVARVFDVGETPSGAPYMVMEYLEGNDLARIGRDRGPLPAQEAVDLVLQACEAIAEAHRVGIVHRDLKPANLFVARRADGKPLVKVLDFGISKFRRSAGRFDELTQSHVMMGSPHYMAPEQLRDARDVDSRADIWALGMILYRLVSGEMPFTGDSTADLCVSVLTLPPRRLLDVRPDAPAALSEVIERCLQKGPGGRFETVDAFAEALAPIASEDGCASIARVKGVASNPEISTTSSSAPPPPFPEPSPRAPSVLPPQAGENPITVHMTFGGTQAPTRAGRRRIALIAGVVGLCVVLVGVAKLATSKSEVGTSHAAAEQHPKAETPPPPASPTPVPVTVTSLIPSASATTSAEPAASASNGDRADRAPSGAPRGKAHAWAPAPSPAPRAHETPAARPTPAPAAAPAPAPTPAPATGAAGDDFAAFGKRK